MNSNADTNINTDTRNYGIDLLRIICLIMVPILHIMNQGGVLTNIGMLDSDYDSAWLLNIACFCAVDCFGLISGYVGYGKRVRYSNLVLLWVRVILYSVLLAALFMIIHPEDFNAVGLAKSFIPALSREYWYFTAYVGLYLFMPMLNLALEKFSKKQCYALCITFIALFSVLTTFTAQTYAFNLFNGLSVLWLVVLYFFGGVLKKYELLSNKSLWLWLSFYVSGTLIVWLSKVILHLNPLTLFGTVIDSSVLVNYLCPFVLLAALGMLGVGANLKIKKGSITQKVISFFAPLSFSVYILHDNPYVRKAAIINKFEFLLTYKPAVMIILLLGCGFAIFVGCSLIDEVRELLFRALKLKKKAMAVEDKIRERLR